MRSMRRAAAVWLLFLVASPPARATFHLWEISEVFSNEDGSVQFVEFETSSAFQNFLLGHVLQTRRNDAVLQTFTFPANLPLESTADRFFLVATPGFEGAAGVAPDFQIPAGFLERDETDEVELVGADAFDFDPAQLPSDGASSLHALGGGTAGVAPATPTNFAGEVGTLPEPGPAGFPAAAALAALAAGRARRLRRSGSRQEADVRVGRRAASRRRAQVTGQEADFRVGRRAASRRRAKFSG